VGPRRICDIYDLFAPRINALTYLLTYLLSAFYFILWTVVSAGYPALLSSSYFERINDDDDDDDDNDINAALIELKACMGIGRESRELRGVR